MNEAAFRNETIIQEGHFRKKDITTYLILSYSIAMACTIVGIVLIPIVIPLVMLIAPRIIGTWECTLTNRAVHVKKGLFIKVKKTIPLEKITDVGSVQGPIMRRFGLYSLTFETAGQSGGATQGGALVKLLGIRDSEAFRDLVLDTRDAANPVGASSKISAEPSEESVMIEIRDSLLRIEQQLKEDN